MLLFVIILIVSKILQSHYKPSLPIGPNDKSDHSNSCDINFLAYFMTYGGYFLYMQGAFHLLVFRAFMGLVTLFMSSVDTRAPYYNLMKCRPETTSKDIKCNYTSIKY